MEARHGSLGSRGGTAGHRGGRSGAGSPITGSNGTTASSRGGAGFPASHQVALALRSSPGGAHEGDAEDEEGRSSTWSVVDVCRLNWAADLLAHSATWQVWIGHSVQCCSLVACRSLVYLTPCCCVFAPSSPSSTLDERFPIVDKYVLHCHHSRLLPTPPSLPPPLSHPVYHFCPHPCNPRFLWLILVAQPASPTSPPPPPTSVPCP